MPRPRAAAGPDPGHWQVLCCCPAPLLRTTHIGSTHHGGSPANLGSVLEGGCRGVLLSCSHHPRGIRVTHGTRPADSSHFYPAQPSRPPPPQLCKGQGSPTIAIPTHPENSTTQTVPPPRPCVGTLRRRSCSGAGAPQIWQPVPGQSRALLSQTKRGLTEFLHPHPLPPHTKKKAFCVFSVWGSDSARFLPTGKKRAAAL